MKDIKQIRQDFHGRLGHAPRVGLVGAGEGGGGLKFNILIF